MATAKKEPSTQDILDAIQGVSDRLTRVDNSLKNLETQMRNMGGAQVAAAVKDLSSKIEQVGLFDVLDEDTE